MPDELLLHISTHLAPAELRALAATCHRLHCIALPLYFESYGFVAPWTHLGLTGEAPLRSLCGARFVSRLEELRCTIDSPSVHARLAALSRVLDRVSQVMEVNLDLCHLEQWVHAHDPDGSVGTASWARTLSNILGRIVVEKRCKVLTVQHGEWDAVIGLFLGAGCKQFSADLRRRSATAWKHVLYKWKRHPPTAPVETERSFQLQTFNCHSPLLFHPLHYSWTIRTINSSPITTLSFESLVLPPRTWNHVLTDATMPTLRTLILGPATVNYTILLRFLARHPSITTLDLGTTTTTTTDFPTGWKSPPNVLPHLTVFTAEPAWVSALLERGTACPSLTHLTLASHIASAPAALARLDHSFATLGRRVAPLTLTLTLNAAPATQAWLRAHAHPAALGRAQRFLYCVSTLRIELRGGPCTTLAPATRRALPGWLAQLPCLRTVVLAPAPAWPEGAAFAADVTRACTRVSVEFEAAGGQG